jgi:hypothetical protein
MGFDVKENGVRHFDSICFLVTELKERNKNFAQFVMIFLIRVIAAKQTVDQRLIVRK